MTVHLLKLCIGADCVDDLAAWVAERTAARTKAGGAAVSEHVTRLFPRRADEIVGAGSLYWVIKGAVLARQPIVSLARRTGADGIERCVITMEPRVIRTEAQPRRAFQGWRYLTAEDAPPDLGKMGRGGMPPELGRELAALGLL